MKTKYFLALVAVLSVFTLRAQINMPNAAAGLPTSAPGKFEYPNSFNSGLTKYNFNRVYIPLTPTNGIPAFDNTTTLPVLVNTTYTNGFGLPILNVLRNNTTKDIVTPVDQRSGFVSMSFLPYAANYHSKFLNGMSGQKTFYAGPTYNAEDETAYSATKTRAENGVPTAYSYLPGKAMVGSSNGAKTTVHFLGSAEVADPGDVFILSYINGDICYSGSYAAGSLTVTKSKSTVHNSEVLNYTDKAGRLICARELKDIAGGASNWLSTYYIYDDFNNLICTVPPLAAKELLSSSCISNTPNKLVDKLCFIYEYDKNQNIISKHVPGKDGNEYLVYDKFENVVISQTPALAVANKWEFAIYDELGRVVIDGIYTGTEPITYWRDVVLGLTAPTTRTVPTNQTLEYWLLNRYTGGAYPTTLDGCEIHTYNYYDDYTNYTLSTLPSFDNSFGIAGEYLTTTEMVIPVEYKYTQGKLIASRTRVLDNGIANNFVGSGPYWITSVYFYDELGRNIQTQTLNPWNTSTWDVAMTQYNFAGQSVLQLFKHNSWSNSNKPATTVRIKNNYGFKTGRLESVEHKLGNGVWEPIAAYTYNELGQVVSKDMGNGVQVQDYTYNMRGQLIGINASDINASSLPADKTYASEINYETGYSKLRYDGTITGYKWRTPSIEKRSYGYDYDLANRLKEADYYEYDNTSWSPWVKTNTDYSVTDLNYDENGNIQSMTQRGPDIANNPADIDRLDYNYDGNRLIKVEDNGVPSNATIKDFENLNAGTQDYSYDANGNLKEDKNKGITNISYNHFDLPTSVTNATGGSINNIYTAKGELIQKTIITTTGTDVYRYWGPFVYKNNDLLYVLHQEGRARWEDGTKEFQYDYFVKDHLSNVRTIVAGTASYAPMAYLASFEWVAANTEEFTFEQIGTVRDLKPLGTPKDIMSGTLNGSMSTKRIGAALLVHGMSGDQINLQGYGYYESEDINAYNTYAPGEDMLNSLSGALMGIGAVGNGEGGGSGISTSTISSLLTTNNYNIYENLKNAVTDVNYPRAYLNYLVFDETMQLSEAHSKVMQLRSSPGNWDLMALPGTTKMPINGYVLVYFSNESSIDVSVDNLSMIQTSGNLLEEQHYYPFGLVIEGGQSMPGAFDRYLTTTNRIQSEIGLELFDFNFRQYDQQIGRFVSVDPLADDNQEFYSPYHYCANDPANFIDPWGLKKLDKYKCPGTGGGGGGFSLAGLWSWLQGIANAIAEGIGSLFDNGGGGGGGGSMSSATSPPAADPATIHISGGGGTSYDIKWAMSKRKAAEEKYMAEFRRAILKNLTMQGLNPENKNTVYGYSISGQSAREVLASSNRSENYTAGPGIKMGLMTWNFLDKYILYPFCNSVVVYSSSIGAPIYNQAHIMYKEGLHSGAPYNPAYYHWSVPYRLNENWEFERNTDVMGNMGWEDGKELIKSTVNVVGLGVRVKYGSGNELLDILMPIGFKKALKTTVKSPTYFKEKGNNNKKK